MARKLSPALQAIYDLELALGNTLLRIDDSPQVVFPLAIYLKDPLHRDKIEATLKIAPPIQWHSSDMFAGYVSEDTRYSVKGPVPQISELVRYALKQFSSNLLPIYQMELTLGNSVDRIEEPAGDRCPLAIILKHRMHKTKIESTLSLPPTVRWWECHDTHYSIEGGYTCEETRHSIAGPLK